MTINAEVLGRRKILEAISGNELGYRSPGFFFLILVWIVSLAALFTNLSQVLFLWLFANKEGLSIKEIIWKLGRNPRHVSSIFVDRFSSVCKEIKLGAATWRALDICYNFGKFKGQSAIADFWLGKLINLQAISCRKKIVSELLGKAFQEFQHEPEIRIASIASGSAQAVLDAMKKSPNLNLRAIFIDTDQSALDESAKLARQDGLHDRIEFIRGTPKALRRIQKRFSPHIIEMCGLLDYFPQERAIQIVEEIYEALADGGFFISCNINENHEKILLDWVFLWRMVYRTENEFASIFREAGFFPENTEITHEPFGVHHIGIARK
jgi:hypothetical protein